MSKQLFTDDRGIFPRSRVAGIVCTLTLAWRAFDGAPVALAANRDEVLNRPAEPPAVRGGETCTTDGAVAAGAPTADAGAGRYVAPRDAEAGGTWIGLTEAGLVVAVTNRWLDTDCDADRSRGLLVRDCLEADSAEEARRIVEREVDARAYDGFNLVLADAQSAFLLAHDGALTTRQFDSGVHVVGNVGGVINGAERFAVPERRREFGEERAESARMVADALVPGGEESAAAWLDRAGEVLADHEYGACLHGDGFGTVSFTRIRTGSAPEFAYADGSPCETDPVSVSLPAGFGTVAADGGSGAGDADGTESQF